MDGLIRGCPSAIAVSRLRERAWPAVTASIRLRPEVHETDRLDTPCLHLVERPYPTRLLLQIPVELLEAHAPVAHVRLKLASLFLVERQRDLLVLTLVAGELLDDALALPAERLVQVARFPLSPLAQPARRQLGQLLGPRLELRKKFLDVARRRGQQPGTDDVVRRPVQPSGQCLIQQVERAGLGLARVGPRRRSSSPSGAAAARGR